MGSDRRATRSEHRRGPSRARAAAPVVIAVTQEKRAVSVARTILRDVREAQLAPGDRLPPEATMIERYRVARSTLREALRILEVQGLISIKFGPDGGPVVRIPTPSDFSRVLTLFLQGMDVTLADIFDARRVMEPVMVRLAAQCPDEGPRAELREILERTESATAWKDFAETMAAFHRRVLTMSGNPILDLWAATLQQTENYREGPPLPDAACEAVRREHLAIGAAILAGDADGAHDLMAAHMAKQERYRGGDEGVGQQRIEWR